MPAPAPESHAQPLRRTGSDCSDRLPAQSATCTRAQASRRWSSDVSWWHCPSVPIGTAPVAATAGSAAVSRLPPRKPSTTSAEAGVRSSLASGIRIVQSSVSPQVCIGGAFSSSTCMLTPSVGADVSADVPVVNVDVSNP